MMFWTEVLEKTLESPLDCKEIQPVYPKGNQSWIFIGRSDAEAETPVLWPPHAKSWLIGKDSCWRDWGQEEKGTTEDEMAGWHHWLYGREPEWTPGVGDGQGGLACCYSWVWKSQTRLSDWTELNWTEETNYRTIALISNASKVMLKILQARFKQYMNCELPDVQAGFRKGEEPEIKLPASERVPEKHLFLLYWLCQSLWLCGSQ